MFKFRKLIRSGKCSCCYEEIPLFGEEVCVIDSPKHRKRIIICNKCVLLMQEKGKKHVNK